MDKEHTAIERIKLASEMSLRHYGKPLVCTYSGGKDSEVVLELFKRSGIPYEVHNSHTTADAPPTVRHIREVFRDLELKGVKCEIQMPTYKGKPITMWKLIPAKRTPPTRIMRYCCQVLKEADENNRFIATGVRWAESKRREQWQSFQAPSKRIQASDTVMSGDNSLHRRMIEQCMQKNKMVVNPIIEWTDDEVWQYYWGECKHHNPLYKMGYYRVGCIGCPMVGKHRYKEFSDFPTYRRAYTRAFDKMLKEREKRGLKNIFHTGEEVFLWWMEDDGVPGQIEMDLKEMME